MQYGVVFHVNLCHGRMRIICFFFCFVENLFQEMVAPPCTSPEPQNDAAELPLQKFSVLFLYG